MDTVSEFPTLMKFNTHERHLLSYATFPSLHVPVACVCICSVYVVAIDNYSIFVQQWFAKRYAYKFLPAFILAFT